MSPRPETRSRRGLALAVLVAVIAVGLSPLAIVAASAPTLALSPSSARPGDTVVATGGHFDKRATGQLTFDGSSTGMPSFQASNGGSFSVSFVVPAGTTSGTHTVRATAGSMTAAATLSVVTSTPPPPTASPTAIPTAPPTVAPTPSPTTAPTATPSVAPTPTPSATPDPGDIGTRDGSYPTSVFAPTGQKPQSKLWFNDGSWWGVLWSTTHGQFEIQRFDWAADRFVETGVAVDARPASSADALWDGSHLVIVSAPADLSNGASPPTTGDLSIRLLRYSYSASTRTFSLDAGFPVTLANAAVEAAVLDRDSTGALWATWTYVNGSGGRAVLVTHSTTDDAHWVAPYTLPVAGADNLALDDISALVQFNGKIGVMWSNQNTDTVGFATHTDGTGDRTWAVNPAIQGPKYADDHLSLRSLQADPNGQVFAAVKTSLDDVSPGSQQPLILLLVLDQNGSWKRSTFGVAADQHTRPIVVLDRENERAYVFATGPQNGRVVNGTQVFGGTIYYKSTGLQSPQFASGAGTPFIRLHDAATSLVNNATSTKQSVTSATGLLVLGSDDGAHVYMHNRLTISPAGPPSDNRGSWQMDEGSGTTLVDISGSGNNGQTVGSPTWVTGHTGLALRLGGTSDYGVVSSSALDLRGPLTLAAWVRPERIATQYIIKKAAFDSADGYELSLSTAGKVFFRLNQRTSLNTYRIDSTTTYPSDGQTWIHIAATYDGTTMRLYVNGVLEGSVAGPPSVGSNTLALGLGAQPDGVSPLQGALDDVHVWSRALSAAEIQGLLAP